MWDAEAVSRSARPGALYLSRMRKDFCIRKWKKNSASVVENVSGIARFFSEEKKRGSLKCMACGIKMQSIAAVRRLRGWQIWLHVK